ncbi:RNA-directed DNA polymerase, eukaryota [Tanacetum coccineum]
MPAQRSNKDQVVRISKSIFVTNFPDNLGSKELWKVCEGYGKVIDVFIPNRRSKAGKRFAFVRFIRVNDLDRLVGNLCTIWIGRFHLHANVARFERANKPVKPSGPSQSICALILLAKEGFEHVKLSYLGGLWVLIELDNEGSKQKFLDHVGVNSWFLYVLMPIMILLVMKVLFGWTLNGKVFEARAKELFTWNPSFLKPTESVYTSDDESKHGTRILNDGAQNSDVEYRWMNVMWMVFETVSVRLWMNGGLLRLDHSQEVHDSSNGESVSSFSHKVHNGGSILDILDDMVRVGHSMGYKFGWGFERFGRRLLASQGDGKMFLNEYSFYHYQGLGQQDKKECVKELNYKHRINFLAWQGRQKRDCISHMDLKSLWEYSTLILFPVNIRGIWWCGGWGSVYLEKSAWVGLVNKSTPVLFVEMVVAFIYGDGSLWFPRLFALDWIRRLWGFKMGDSSGLAFFVGTCVMELSHRRSGMTIFNSELGCPLRLPKIGGLSICREWRFRLPTRVNLSRRGVLLDSHLCPLCNAAMEDVQHVFFRCDVARVVLRKICRWWDLDWQEICSFSDWDAWFLSFRLSSRLKSILEGGFYVAWWRIWRLRNQLVFDALPPNRSTIFDDIVSWSFL